LEEDGYMHRERGWGETEACSVDGEEEGGREKEVG